jgi:DNA-binding NarL/FixJ family response regulator
MINRRGFLRLCGLVTTGVLLATSRLPVAQIAALFDDEPSLEPASARKLIRELNRPTYMPPSYEPLIEREAEVLLLTARGLSKQDIAKKLGISEHSVDSHLKSLMHKTRYTLAFVKTNSAPSQA